MSTTVATSVLGALAGALSVSMAPPAPGASVYQLIDAVQFMNVFGRMFDRREPGRVAGGGGRRWGGGVRELDSEGVGGGNATDYGNATNANARAFRREARRSV